MKLIGYFLFLYTLICCGQKQEEQKTSPSTRTAIKIALQDVTSKNIMDYLAGQVKEYDKHPMYAIRPLQNNCIFTILLNGRRTYQPQQKAA